jgi:hypothetical protein
MTPFLASSPMMAKAVWDLPEPDSPTIPRVSPAEREVEVVDGHHIAVRGLELDPQIFHIQ